jgi:hypothetical protein
MIRINISEKYPDPTLNQTLEQVTGEIGVVGALDVGNAQGVEGAVRAVYSERPVEPYGLDLISHSRDGVLELGTWMLKDGDADTKILRDHLGERAVQEIRLLGCITAMTEAGQRGVRYLKTLFPKVQIWSSTVPLQAYDFGPAGILSNVADAVLADAGNLPDISDSQVMRAHVERWFARFRAYTDYDLSTVLDNLRVESLEQVTAALRRRPVTQRWEIRQYTGKLRDPFFSPLNSAIDLRMSSLNTAGNLRRLPDVIDSLPGPIGPLRDVLAPRHELAPSVDGLRPGLATARGLLALPDFEAISPSNREPLGGFHRATVLLGGWFVRLYPTFAPNGVIARTSRRLLPTDGILLTV